MHYLALRKTSPDKNMYACGICYQSRKIIRHRYSSYSIILVISFWYKRNSDNASFSSDLSSRNQHVVVNGMSSSKCNITCGMAKFINGHICHILRGRFSNFVNLKRCLIFTHINLQLNVLSIRNLVHFIIELVDEIVLIIMEKDW